MLSENLSPFPSPPVRSLQFPIPSPFPGAPATQANTNRDYCYCYFNVLNEALAHLCRFKNVMFVIKLGDEVGLFEVSAKFMGVSMEKVELVFQVRWICLLCPAPAPALIFLRGLYRLPSWTQVYFVNNCIRQHSHLACLLACLPACLLACLPACSLACLLACLFTFSLVSF